VLLPALFGTESSNAVDAKTETWVRHVHENASFVLRLLLRTVYYALVDAELFPMFAKSQSLLAKRRQQRPPDDPPPPLHPSSPPSRPWAGSGRRRRPARAVTSPRPPPPQAHYHSTRVLRRSPSLPSCRQPPLRLRAVLELVRGAANGYGIRTRSYPPPGHSRHVFPRTRGRCRQTTVSAFTPPRPRRPEPWRCFEV